MVWNMEWMNDLFNEQGNFRPDDEKTQHAKDANVKQRRLALAAVINELAPDVLLVVEGPNKTEELQLFLDTDLKGTWKGHIQASPRMSQCIGIAVRTDTGKFADPAFVPTDTLVMTAFMPWQADLENDGIQELYKFERSPLYAELTTADNKKFRILGLHLKSKLVANALEWSKWWENADANRRKIFAQASQIRMEFLDAYLTEAATEKIPLIVCGDVNDGPGMDTSERRIMGSGIERLMGNVWFPHLSLGNALFDTLTVTKKKKLDFAELATTRFSDPIFNGVFHREWIDHILYTRNTADWVKDAKIYKTLQHGSLFNPPYKHSSDHYPITAEIEL